MKLQSNSHIPRARRCPQGSPAATHSLGTPKPSRDPQHLRGAVPSAGAGRAVGRVPGALLRWAASHDGEPGAGRAAGPKPPDGNIWLLTRCGFRVITPSGLPCFVRSRDGRPLRSPRPAPPRLCRARCHRGPGGSREPFPTRMGRFEPRAGSPAALGQSALYPGTETVCSRQPSPGARKVTEPPWSLCHRPSCGFGDISQGRSGAVETPMAFCPSVSWGQAGRRRLGVTRKLSCATCPLSICCLKPSRARCKSPCTCKQHYGITWAVRGGNFPSHRPPAQQG